MNQEPNHHHLLAIPPPNEHQPLANQLELFLNQFNRITQNVFTQIASSSSSSLSSSSSTTNSNQTNPEITVLQEIIQLEIYLYKLLEINYQHDRNSKKIQNLFLTLNSLNSNQFKKKLDQIFSIKNKLDLICSDGQNEKNRFAELNQCESCVPLVFPLKINAGVQSMKELGCLIGGVAIASSL
jgi:hypothetical protein